MTRSAPSLSLIVLLSFCSVCNIIGCGFSQQIDESDHDAKVVEENVGDVVIDGVAKQVVAMHDFGIVRPIETHGYWVRVQNETEESWVLRQAVSTCACTASRASNETVQPGAVETYEVVYSAGNPNGAESRSVLFQFAREGEADPSLEIEVQIHATVCLPLTPRPPKLEFARVGQGSSAETTIHLDNYSDVGWENVEIVSAPDWLSAEIVPVAHSSAAGHAHPPRQTFALVARISNPDLQPGGHFGDVTVIADSNEATRTFIPVIASIRDPVTVSPSVLMFGRLKPNQSSTKSVILTFADPDSSWRADAIQVESDTGQSIETACHQLTENRWKLDVTLVPRVESGIIDGSLLLQLPDAKRPMLTIPIVAKVEGAGVEDSL